jgi:hypothetical protein
VKASGFLLATLLPVLLGVAAPGSATAQESAAAGDELDRVGDELVRLTFLRRPWQAVERGWTGEDLGLGRYGFEERGRWLDALEAFDERLEALDPESLPAPRAAAFDALRALIEAEDILADSRALERWHTAGYVARVELVLRSHMLEAALTEEDGLRLARVLAELPEYWRNAEASLVSPIGEWSREARGRVEELDLFLRTHEEEVLAALPGAMRATGAEVFAGALESTEGFRRWLERPSRETSRAQTRVGSRRWHELVTAATGTTWDVARIKWELLRDLARTEREHGARWRTDARRTGADPALVAALDQDLFERTTAAMELAHEAGVLAAPADRLPVRFTLGDSPVRFGRDALYARDGDDLLVVLDPGLVVGADDATLTALAVRHGLPGETLFRQHAAAAGGAQPRYLWNRGMHEGWGLYALDWMLRIDWHRNPHAEDEVLIAEIARLRVIEAARLLAALELHTEDFSIEEAAEGYRRRTGLGLDRAHEEVRRAVIDPLLGVGYLGWAELVALEQRFGADSGPKRALARTVAQALDAPHLRPRDLEAWIFGRRDR